MSQKARIPIGSTNTTDTGEQAASTQSEMGLSRDTLFQLLGNQRRRWVIRYLLQEERVQLGDLAVQLAAWEHQTTVSQVTSTQRKRAYTSLQQHHLPVLTDADVINYTKTNHIIEVTERIQTFDLYLEVVPDRNIPWSVYYLGMGVVSCMVVGLSMVIEGGLISKVPDIGWAALIAGTVTVSASVHTYFSRSMRVDTLPTMERQPPIENDSEPTEDDSEHE